jgi:hypothetical protein
MRRAYISTLALASLLWADVASSVPPDQIHNSPIPPLQAPQRRTARRVPVQQQTPPAPQNGVLFAPTTALPANGTNGALPAGEQPAPYPAATPQSAPGDSDQQDQQVDYDAQRTEIWNSPEMREARVWVMEYVRRSAQSNEREGREFLQRLSQVSPNEMRNWLERYQQQRMRLEVERSSNDFARQLMLENAAGRQEAARQSFDNINQYQSAAAAWAQDRFSTLNTASQHLRVQRSTQRDMTVLNDREQDFNPFWPVFDPASPQGRRARWAAAASLPGDLPPSDPRNFIRGEEGIDTGAGTSPQDAAAAGGSGESTGAAAGAATGGGPGEGQ